MLGKKFIRVARTTGTLQWRIIIEHEKGIRRFKQNLGIGKKENPGNQTKQCYFTYSKRILSIERSWRRKKKI